MRTKKVIPIVLSLIVLISFAIIITRTEKSESSVTGRMLSFIDSFSEFPITDTTSLTDGTTITEYSDDAQNASLYITTAANGEILRYEFYDKDAEKIYTLSADDVLLLNTQDSEQASVTPEVYKVR